MKCENTSVMLSIKPIAYIHSDFSEKFGIPRQSGLVDSLQAKIIFTEEFRNGDCIRGIEEFSHLWLIWEFSKNQRDKWTPTVRPPRLGGNKRKGVFASRAPFRPNPLGLSCVRLEKAVPNSPEGPILYVSGADLLDGTPPECPLRRCFAAPYPKRKKTVSFRLPLLRPAPFLSA